MFHNFRWKHPQYCSYAFSILYSYTRIYLVVSYDTVVHEEIKYIKIITWIGRVLEIIKYKNTYKWSFIKIYLTDTFESLTTAISLQIQLNSIKMRNGEEWHRYCHKVEKLYNILCTVSNLINPLLTRLRNKIIFPFFFA